MRILFIIILTSLFSISCGNQKEEKKTKIVSEKRNMKTKSLLENVKLAINPKFKNWVLFENGTYIIFDTIDGITDINDEAIRLMKEFGPVSSGGPAGDFGVTTLNQTEGWIVSGHGYGIYTYVNPSELDTSSPDDVTIGLYGRSKRDKDGQKPKIIHINSIEK